MPTEVTVIISAVTIEVLNFLGWLSVAIWVRRNDTDVAKCEILNREERGRWIHFKRVDCLNVSGGYHTVHITNRVTPQTVFMSAKCRARIYVIFHAILGFCAPIFLSMVIFTGAVYNLYNVSGPEGRASFDKLSGYLSPYFQNAFSSYGVFLNKTVGVVPILLLWLILAGGTIITQGLMILPRNMLGFVLGRRHGGSWQ